MSLINGHGIVPQLFRHLATSRVLGWAVCSFAVVLAGCATIEVKSPKPVTPETLAAAQAYLERSKQTQLELDTELEAKTRACYDRFLVADCLEAVRVKRAEYRRAHVEAETAANDIVRIHNYNQRQREKQEKQQNIK